MANPYEPVRDEKFVDANYFFRKELIISGKAMEFIGCYSGRIGKKEEGAALGLCWNVCTIELICQSRKLGKHPHIMSNSVI